MIGARYFGAAAAKNANTTLQKLALFCGNYVSPRDAYGHGTSSASIAAGREVPDVRVGLSRVGTAKGTAVHARLAIYKALWCDQQGTFADVAAAMDAAVADGVDVLSLSLGTYFFVRLVSFTCTCFLEPLFFLFRSWP